MLLYGLVAAVCILTFVGVANAGELWSVSAKNIRIGGDERIVGFSVRLKSASVYSLPMVPMAWTVSVKNFLNVDPPWNTSLDALTGVGSASLDPSFFNAFLYIDKYSGKYAAEIPLDVELKIVATVDFETSREIIIPMSDLLIEPIVGQKVAK